MILTSLQLINKARNLASVADANTKLRIPHIKYREPFSTIGWFVTDFMPRNNWPATKLHAQVSERYNASEWMFSTKSDA